MDHWLVPIPIFLLLANGASIFDWKSSIETICSRCRGRSDRHHYQIDDVDVFSWFFGNEPSSQALEVLPPRRPLWGQRWDGCSVFSCIRCPPHSQSHHNDKYPTCGQHPRASNTPRSAELYNGNQGKDRKSLSPMNHQIEQREDILHSIPLSGRL